MKLKLEPISKWQSSETHNIALSAPMSPMLAAKDFIAKVFEKENMVMTGLFRIKAEGETTFRTWEHADLEPVQIDVICVVLNFRHLAVFGEIGSRYMPIAIVLDGNAQFSELYTTYEWDSAPTVEEIAKVLETVDFSQLKNEFEDFRWKTKGEEADDWFLERNMEEQQRIMGITIPRDALSKWDSMTPREKYSTYKTWKEKK